MGTALGKAVASATALFLAAGPGLAPTATAQAAAPAELTSAQWREDLRFMAAEMQRRHANLYHDTSREKFAQAVADLDARIPTMQRGEIIVGMMRIAAMVGDGHTRIDPRKDKKFGFASLPLKLYMFEDGIYVRAAAPEFGGLVGARVQAIGAVPIDEAVRRAAELSSRDNSVGPKLFVPLYLGMPDILHALKLSGSRDAAVLTLQRGDRSWTATVPAGAIDPAWPADTDISLSTPPGWTDARTTAATPVWLAAPLEAHRMVDLSDRKALYVQLNTVADADGETLDQFAGKIAERSAATNPRALILDLRLNQGGNGDLRNELVRALIRAEDADTRLFVLTWRGTFSASQFILDDLDRLSNAVIIGEPASSKPSSYGDAYRTPLPNSGINVRTSIKWWQSGQNRDPWTWVDIATPLTFADYVAGRDPALEAALGYAPKTPLDAELLAAVRSGGRAGVLTALDNYRRDTANRYADQGGQMIRAAMALFSSELQDAALATADYAARQFPTNPNAWSVLAQLAEAAGKADVARVAATRLLELDPNDRAGRAVLERVQAKAG